MEISGVDVVKPPADIIAGTTDFRGKPALRSSTGGWRSAGFIICLDMAERFANFGISSNLITYLTGPVGLSTAAAAASVNAWSGTALLLPLLGGFVADSFLGRFRTILYASLLYVSGLALLTYSTMVPSLASHATQLQVILFFSALYLVAFAQGGYRPCAQAFGAGQFDEHDPEESKAKSSYFNWRFFCICAGILISRLLLNYIQDNFSWAVGYAIPCVMMLVALIVFLLGSKTYRFCSGGKQQSQFTRIGNVFIEAAKNRQISADEEETIAILSHKTSQKFGFLDKAVIGPCSIADVEEAKGLLRLVPIWVTCLVYAVAFAQNTTLFTKQGATMDRTITSGFDIPAATLQCFISLAIVIFIPIYDRILVPVARSITQRPTGITMLQRIGIGIFLSFVTMVIAAVVEMKRLRTAQDHGLIDKPNETIPMSVWWLVPQYFLLGVSEVFTVVGLQEFFYDQVPSELRSVGLSLYLSVLGVGDVVSSLMVSAIGKATSHSGEISWFANNLNKGHLDYFYWLLASLNSFGLASFVYFANSYIYKTPDSL